jgi:1,4-alpha-glucan branching enzyme
MQIYFGILYKIVPRTFFDNCKGRFQLKWSMLCLVASFTGGTAVAQDSVEVKFFYKSAGNPTSVFLPGEFNNWGPNSGGTIAQNAPSKMTFDAGLGQWTKTVRLRVGGQPGGGVPGAYQYKINENGANTGWRSDPLNPRQNAADNDNSILYVKNPTIHYLLPNSLSGIVDPQSLTVTAYIFPSSTTSVDTSSIRVVIDSTEYTHAGSAYDAATKLLSFIPTGQVLPGVHTLRLYANTVSRSKSGDSTTFVVAPQVVVEPLPAGIVDGINYLDNSTVTLSLYAPKKQFVAVIGDFNDWQIDPAYYMKRTPDSSRYWITMSNLQPQKEHLFQYYVDANLKIADPYAEKVLDPSNDQFINSTTYPDLIAYPAGQTQENASVLQTDQQPYVWEVEVFQRPAPKDLVIYELLIRDFIDRHDYKTLIDTLDYLDNLGINAIELMPINEFEGNISWGYNPSFYFAPDKYYGPKNDLKQFIDECHKRGIAVILDMVLNHSFGQSPFVRLYSSGNYGPPTDANPWYNITATHPFSVGYDFNHESAATKALVDRVNAFWLTEYKVDGYRFDLSKGFTQKVSGSNVGLWGAYDASRIAILKRMADRIWDVDSTAYVILEHFADNTEERELSDYGMMLWGNLNIAYSQSAMGWLEDSGMQSDLSGGYYKTRGWSKPHLVTYMESHDEPWLMYKNLQFGRSSGSYNVKDLSTALNRIKLVAAFFLTLPGPKMIWQFGELGYDQNLPENGRTDPKPILWNYFTQPNRRNLYKTYAALLKLRNENEVFRSTETLVSMRVGQGQYDRRINLSHSSMNVTIAGNFGVTVRDVNPNFQHSGTWYDYFSGDSISVTNTQALMAFTPGEFHIYTTKKLEIPEPGIITAIDDAPVATTRSFGLQQNYPNPFNPETTIRFELPVAGEVSAKVFNVIGEEVATLVEKRMEAGTNLLRWQGVDAQGRQVGSGVYFVRVSAGKNVAVRKMMMLR